MFFLAFKILPPDGTVKYLESNIQHEYSALGELLETFCTTVDVTERKRAQEEHEKLRKLESDLTHINRVNMMGELAASLSHEMNQPITAVIGHAHAAKTWLGRQPPDLEGRDRGGCPRPPELVEPWPAVLRRRRLLTVPLHTLAARCAQALQGAPDRSDFVLWPEAADGDGQSMSALPW
jgi:signal transduction histidine kinase